MILNIVNIISKLVINLLLLYIMNQLILNNVCHNVNKKQNIMNLSKRKYVLNYNHVKNLVHKYLIIK